MRKNRTIAVILFLLLVACNLFQPRPTENVPPLVFPSYQPTYTPLPAATPIPEIITPTPVTPTALPSPLTLTQVAQWNAPNLADIFWFPESDRFVLVRPDELTLYKAPNWDELWSVPSEGKERAFASVSVSSNGNFLVNLSEGDQGQKSAQILNVDNGELVEKKRTAPFECWGTIAKSIYLDDGTKTLLVAYAENKQGDVPAKIYRWTIAPYTCELIGQGVLPSVEPGAFQEMLVSPDQKIVILVTVGRYNGEIKGRVIAWEIASRKKLCTIEAAAASFRPSDGLLAVADVAHQALAYWNVRSCESLKSLAWVDFPDRQALAFTSDGKYLLTYRQNLQLWEADTAELLLDQPAEQPAITGLLRFSPDGKYLITVANPHSTAAQVLIWVITKR